MNDKLHPIYFGVVKLIFLCLGMIYFITIKQDILKGDQLLEVPLLFVFASLLVVFEITQKLKPFLLSAAIIVLIILIYGYDPMYFLFLPIVFLDVAAFLKLHFSFYFCSLIGIAGCSEKLLYFVVCLFMAGLYYQHYDIIYRYKTMVAEFLNKESQLLSAMDKQDLRHRNAIEKFALIYENEKLEEKGRLSQALHDKIGHSINGSIFQLEACKLLIDKKPEETKEKLQKVIENLRTSMDEIRLLLRKEKPKKGEMKWIQLKKLCSDFKAQYNIEVDLKAEGDLDVVPENVWGLLFDNTLEAFSNALKYSKCDMIAVHIFVFNQLIRCTIKDNGRGCKNIKEGMGLSGMKERVSALGGTLSIISEVGFEINLLMPLKGEEKFG